MDIDFKEIYSRDILNEVKKIVVRNNIKIHGYKEKEADKKVLEIIDDLCSRETNDKNEEKYNLSGYAITSNDKERIIKLLVLYYVAFYFDNLDLLKYFIANNFNFYGYSCNGMNLFVLDKSISSKFELYE